MARTCVVAPALQSLCLTWRIVPRGLMLMVLHGCCSLFFFFFKEKFRSTASCYLVGNRRVKIFGGSFKRLEFLLLFSFSSPCAFLISSGTSFLIHVLSCKCPSPMHLFFSTPPPPPTSSPLSAVVTVYSCIAVVLSAGRRGGAEGC